MKSSSNPPPSSQGIPSPRVAILGDGQLGRMLVQEGRRMGFEMSCVGPDVPTSTRDMAHHWFDASSPDLAQTLAATQDAIIIESDHADIRTLQALEAAGAKVFPKSDALACIQDRLKQRLWLREQAIPQPEFHDASTPRSAFEAHIQGLGGRAVVKTRCGGYDGRGQVLVDGPEALDEAFELGQNARSVMERFIPFVQEVSVVVGRSASGTVVAYPVVENIHHRHALLVSIAPAQVSADVAAKAIDVAKKIITELGYVGVLAVEFFVTEDGQVLVNEIAPRVHNSGHLTWGAGVPSQFEQHLRLVAGFEPGRVSTMNPAVMLNIYGDSWDHPSVDWALLRNTPEVRFYVYEKAARPARKIGHLLLTAETREEVVGLTERLFKDSGLDDSLPGALERLQARFGDYS